MNAMRHAASTRAMRRPLPLAILLAHAAFATAPAGVQNYHGPYIDAGALVDPWGHEYVYRYPGSHNSTGFDVFSMGPDGREGGDDITNWTKKSE